MKDSEKFPKLYPKLMKICDRSTPKLRREVLNLIQKDYKKLKNNKSTEDHTKQILSHLEFFYTYSVKFDDLTIKDQIVLAYLNYFRYFRIIGFFFGDALPPRSKISKVALKVAISGISKHPRFKEKYQAHINLFISELHENGVKFV